MDVTFMTEEFNAEEKMVFMREDFLAKEVDSSRSRLLCGLQTGGS